MSPKRVAKLAQRGDFQQIDRALASGRVSQFTVLTTLTAIKSDIAVKELRSRMAQDVEPGIKIAVLSGLRTHKRNDAVSIIQDLASDAQPEVSIFARDILKEWGL